MSELQNIQLKINETQKSLDEIQSRIVRLRKTTKVIGQHPDAISMSIEQIKSAEKEHSHLIEIWRDLQSLKSNELRLIAEDQAKQEYESLMLIMADIYALLVQAAERLPDFRNQSNDYISQIQIVDVQLAKHHRQTTMFLYEDLRRTIPSLLDKFPRSIMTVGTLPLPSFIRSNLKK